MLTRRRHGHGQRVREFLGTSPSAPLQHLEELPAVTDEATVLAKDLKRRGFRFVGPTTIYAFMQAAGLVADLEKRMARK